jgi:dTDP-4-dehydrorhamnose reductase
MKKSVLVVGSSGYVGRLITRHLSDKYQIRGLTRNDFDLRIEKDVADFAQNILPDIIIHAAGIKDIKFCEANQKEAYESNELSVVNLVKAFPGKKIIYISSDYVFEGEKGNYSESDNPNPKTIYGKSKLAGERYGLENSNNFIVLRSSAIFDNKASFPAFLNKELTNNRGVECFANTFYSPSYYEDFLSTLEKMIENDSVVERIYHSCGEKTSRYEFGLTYAKIFCFDKNLIKKSYADTNYWFLFPDLSLVNIKTNERLGTKTTSLEKALLEIKKKNEDNQTL